MATSKYTHPTVRSTLGAAKQTRVRAATVPSVPLGPSSEAMVSAKPKVGSKKRTAGVIDPELFVDVVIGTGTKCAVIGWTKGQVSIAPMMDGKLIDHRIEVVPRPDVETHFGLSSTECRGFFLHVDTPYSTDWHVAGTSAESTWSTKLNLPAAVAQPDVSELLRHYAELGVDTRPYERTVNIDGRMLRLVEGQSDEVAVHIEYAFVDAEGNGVMVGWATDAPSHRVGFVVGDSVLLMEDCYRFERSDITPVTYGAIGQRSGRAGFMGRLKVMSPEIQDIQVVLVKTRERQVLPLNSSGRLATASSEQIASELAKIWTEPDTLKERAEKVDGWIPPGVRTPVDVVPRPTAAFFDGLSRGRTSVVLLRRERTAIIDSFAPLLAYASQLGAVLLVNVGVDGRPIDRAEVEHLQALLGREISIIEGAADLPFSSIVKLFTDAAPQNRVLYLDTQACLDRGALSILESEASGSTAFFTASTLRAASLDVRPILALEADNAAVGHVGGAGDLGSVDLGWLDIPCWCFDVMLKGLASAGKLHAELRIGALPRTEAILGGEVFHRRLARLRYEFQATRWSTK